MIILIMSTIALAQSGGDYTLAWWTIDGGSHVSSGGAFTINSTMGQPDAGKSMSGGQFDLQSGFWLPFDTADNPLSPKPKIYLPLVMSK